MKIEVLGAFGSKLKDLGMTSFLINKRFAIDAGNIIKKGEKIFHLEHIILTHQHLDHIADIPYLVAESFPIRRVPLKIYAHQDTLAAISKHILNAEIWPDFSNIKIAGSGYFSVRYVNILRGRKFDIDGLEITPFESNHTVPTLGYRIYDRKENKSFLITGDTWKQDTVWDLANSDKSVAAIFIDVSYPRRMRELGKKAKHLSSDAFEEELRKLKRKDIRIFVYHLKPAFRREIMKEISDISRKTKLKIDVLNDGDVIHI